MEAVSPRRHIQLYVGIFHDTREVAPTYISGSNDGDALSNNTNHTSRARPLRRTRHFRFQASIRASPAASAEAKPSQRRCSQCQLACAVYSVVTVSYAHVPRPPGRHPSIHASHNLHQVIHALIVLIKCYVSVRTYTSLADLDVMEPMLHLSLEDGKDLGNADVETSMSPLGQCPGRATQIVIPEGLFDEKELEVMGDIRFDTLVTESLLGFPDFSDYTDHHFV